MTWLSPIWLAGLVPWVVVSLWLLWGRRPKTSVPFLDLWRGPVEHVRPRSAVQAPPVALALLLMAVLLAIVAAASPVLKADLPGRGTPLSIIVDRGASMSAVGPAGQARFRALAEEAMGPIAGACSVTGPVGLTIIPGGGSRRTDASDWIGDVWSSTPTALDTAEMVRAAVAARLQQTRDPVVVLSDQMLGIESDRLVQVTPDRAPANAGITRLAARGWPRPQVMVRLATQQSGQKGASLAVTSDGTRVERKIELPGAGKERDYFIDLPRLGPVVEVELAVQDDWTADNRAWLVRERNWPSLEARSPLPAELLRVMQVYARHRPSSRVLSLSASGPQASRRVAVAGDIRRLGPDEAGVVVAAGPVTAVGVALPATQTAAVANVRVANHPITQDVDWASVTAAARGASLSPPGSEWTPLVWRGDEVLVAARDTTAPAGTAPVRQVWVGSALADWARRPDYVVFWTHVFDWLGEPGGASAAEAEAAGPWVGHRVGPLGSEWQLSDTKPAGPAADKGLWPGLYRRADGALRAVNAPALRTESATAMPWRQRLSELAAGRRAQRGLGLAPGLLVLALGCGLGSAATWRRAPSARRYSRKAATPLA